MNIKVKVVAIKKKPEREPRRDGGSDVQGEIFKHSAYCNLINVPRRISSVQFLNSYCLINPKQFSS